MKRVLVTVPFNENQLKELKSVGKVHTSTWLIEKQDIVWGDFGYIFIAKNIKKPL